MTPFYISQRSAQFVYLTGEEAHHCIKVMRKKLGDEIIAVDGQGAMLVCTVHSLGKERVEMTIAERHEGWGEKPQRIFLMISPLHKPDRFEWLIEKAVELGATEIIPYVGKHTVKTGLRRDRMERIMIAALKQCMRSRLPTLHDPMPLKDAILLAQADIKLLGHAELGKPLATYSDAFKTALSASILIGPEGDFAPEELDLALQNGYLPTSLGHNRLRSETAAIHLLGIVKNEFGF